MTGVDAIVEGTRSATLVRLLLTPLLLTPGAMLTFVFLGAGSPVGLLLAIPVLYLAWTWLVDVASLIRGFGNPRAYTPRRRYLWFGAASVLPFVVFWSWNRWG